MVRHVAVHPLCCWVLSATATHNSLTTTAAPLRPNFLYPVRKGPNQFYMLFAQWQVSPVLLSLALSPCAQQRRTHLLTLAAACCLQGKHCILTFLEHYRKNPATAEPYMAVTLYEDLIDRKQLVLVRGDYSAHLTKKVRYRLWRLLVTSWLG